MRVFMLALLAGLSFAAPQGYNYQLELGSSENSIQAILNQFQLIQRQSQQQQPQNFFYDKISQLQFSTPLILDQPDEYQIDSQLLQPQNFTIAKQPQAIETESVIKPPNIKHQTEHVLEHQTHLISQPEIQKNIPETYQKPFQTEFYYLSAPPEENDPKDLEKHISLLKKNLRVVFIKAPENNGLENAVLQLAQQSANTQTAIYVLTKQHDTAEFAHKLQAIQSSTPQRPEVAFIKYRTQEDAEHAQRVIQAEYEALNGPNHINRPSTGVAHNFTSATDNTNSVEHIKPLTEANKTESAKLVSKYLPAAIH